MKIFFLSLLFMITLGVNAQKVFLIGGALADDNAEIWNAFLYNEGKDQDPYFGIITAASDPADSAANAASYIQLI